LRSTAASSRIGDQIGIVGFTSQAEIFANLTAIHSQADKDGLQLAVDRAFANGGTDLGIGLAAGYQVLSQDAGTLARRAVVFLTDGQGSYTGEASAYANKGWRVYTVGLSDQHNAELLRSIAAQTGGRYFNSPTSVDLQTIYSELSGRLTGRATLFQEILNVSQGVIQRVVKVIPGVPDLTVNLYWPGNLVAASSADALNAEVNLRLIDPEGNIVDPSDSSVEYQQGATYKSYNLIDPKPGEWFFEIEVAASNVPLDLTLEGKTRDVTAPVGQLVATSSFINSTSVVIQLVASDDGQAQSDLEYRLTQDRVNWSDWLPVTPSIFWSLQNNSEVQYLCTQIRDAAGNVSQPACTNFIVDLVRGCR